MSTDHRASGGAIPAPPDGAERPHVAVDCPSIPPHLAPPDAIRPAGRPHPSTFRPQQEA